MGVENEGRNDYGYTNRIFNGVLVLILGGLNCAVFHSILNGFLSD